MTTGQAARVDKARVELSDGARADQAHVHLHFVLEQLHGLVDARLAVSGHGVEEGAADADAAGAEAEGFEDVRRATDAAVDVDLDFVLPAALAQGGHDLGEDFDARAGGVELAAAVVGEDDAGDAVLDGEEDVFDALDALEDDGHGGDGLEPGDVFPGEGGVDEGGDGAGGALGAVDVVAAAGLDAGALVGELGAHVLLAAAELGRVDRDEEALAAAGFGVLDDAVGDVAVAVDVQLQPLHLVATLGVDDVVERARRQRRDHLHHVVIVGRPRQHHLTFGVTQLAECGRRHVEGDRAFGAQHGGRVVDVLDVDEDPRSEPDFVEGGVVLAHGLSMLATTHHPEREKNTYNLVIRATRIIRPRRLLHDIARHLLKVQQIVAGGQRRHQLHALLALRLLGVRHFLLLLDSFHVHLAQVFRSIQILVERVGGVDGIELLGGVLAGILEDDLLATGVFYFH